MRPIYTLSPFVSKLLIEDVVRKADRYRQFDEGDVRDIRQASANMEPAMFEFQGAVMIADVSVG